MRSSASVLLRTWDFLNILSLDVVAGALAGGMMAAVLLDTSPVWAYWVVMPLAVWLIYTTDHLIDGYRAGRDAKHRRHIFHQKYMRSLLLVVGLTLVFTAYIAFTFLPVSIIRFGLFLGTLAAAYLLLILFIGKNSAGWLPKEILVAAFYTAGIWIPVVLETAVVENSVLILMILFFLLAFEDLLLLSHIEAEVDKKEGVRSMPLALGMKRTITLLYILFAIVSLSSFLLIFLSIDEIFIRAGLIILLMQIALFLIQRNSGQLRRNDLYRYLSEAVFFLPALMAI